MYFGFYCIILYFTQRIEFVVFIESVCFGTLISVENSHFNKYSVSFANHKQSLLQFLFLVIFERIFASIHNNWMHIS